MSSDPAPLLNRPVEVDFSVLINANSDLELRTQGLPTMENVIVAAVNMNASSFNGLIEFWEPSSDPEDPTKLGEIHSHFDLEELKDDNDNDVESYKLRALDLYTDLVEVLAGEFDCTGADPFVADVTNEEVRNANYNALSDFGRVALAQVAHAVLGHVAATALITNDQEFMDNMLASSGPESCADIIEESSQSNTQADLAATLVKALLSKGYTADFADVIADDDDAPDLTAIVKQVVTQDPVRARGQDNNVLSPNVHQKLMFYAGDIIYMSITVKYPTVKSSSKDVVPADSIGTSGEQRFDLKITLA